MRAALLSLASAWERYLDQFVAWKVADAAAIEGDLVKMATAMVTSAARKCASGAAPSHSPDKQAIREQARDVMARPTACMPN